MIKKIFNSALQGLFWLLPIAAIIIIASWLFGQATLLSDYLFNLLEFDPQKYRIIWTAIGVFFVVIALSVVGALATTRLAKSLENLIRKVPLYSTIKDIIGIFNSSKKDTENTLVVAVKGFTYAGYNIGLMYSTKESIIKDHYTITIFLSPLPSSGFMFEVHKDDILVIENAGFNDNLQYIISMGTRSFTEILKTTSQGNLPTLTQYFEKLEQAKKENKNE